METNKVREFEVERSERIKEQESNHELLRTASSFMNASIEAKYSYNFTWMGRPVIQYPQDMIAMQEIIWRTKPDLIIETGIAHGGSLIYYASLLELCGNGEVLGIDIDIREHNRKEIEKHPMFRRIKLIEGSSVSEETLGKVREHTLGKQSIMVVLDSNHTHEHVLKELELYSGFVSKENYLVVFDTIVEDLPADTYNDRPWARGNNPKTAVHEYLKSADDFIIDYEIQNKLLITVAPDGYLKRVH
ncbi:MAG: cephalosporin hydroxylase [Bacteroidetes bacterium]|nr:MAG: cephalosporin hydroxylase [Bacteroidota bacterium]REJ99713.1 MAG: cephalosporin hydroxylase [Bacteroidota bacterium]REK32907.1 MAG: cephalosporin hydroxylase [Bacteroidota bacterium]REK47712.1 MAG: cephalosporin hydroxylase [Bacteroidota bacterium]